MKEKDVIVALAAQFADSARQRNERFSSDAEILELGETLLAVTVDDYSAEDRMSGDDPAQLGWNLITATVSDLLAVGAAPRFALNSFVASPAMDEAYLRTLASGMQQALTASGAHMAGGDIGTGADWRFTGVALGEFLSGQAPLSRRVACEAGAVVATGAFGDANLFAAAGLLAGMLVMAPRFEVRLAESAALAALTVPAGCMDTSDGLVNVLETMCDLDPALRIELDLASVPLAPGVKAAAGAMRIPPETFLMGSAGEYELVALVPTDAVEEIVRAGWQRIGSFDRRSPGGLIFRRDEDLIAHPGLPDPRDAGSFEAYCAQLIDLSRALFEERRRP
jgi:thiamine monophosphate kinase